MPDVAVPALLPEHLHHFAQGKVVGVLRIGAKVGAHGYVIAQRNGVAGHLLLDDGRRLLGTQCVQIRLRFLLRKAPQSSILHIAVLLFSQGFYKIPYPACVVRLRGYPNQRVLRQGRDDVFVLPAHTGTQLHGTGGQCIAGIGFRHGRSRSGRRFNGRGCFRGGFRRFLSHGRQCARRHGRG